MAPNPFNAAARREICWGSLRGWCALAVSQLILTLALQAGNGEYIARVWQTRDGLPQDSITSIIQTPDGYLWLATFNGLARFDGARFTIFDEGNTPALQSSRLVRLDVDAAGGLWIITEGGALSRFGEGHFKSFTVADGVPASGAAAVVRGPQDRVLLVDRGGGVCRFEGGRWVPNEQWGFLRGNAFSLFTDQRDQVWVWFREKRHFGRIAGEQLVLLKGPDGEREAEVRAFAPSRTGGLWLVISNAVWHYEEQTKEWKVTNWKLPEWAHGLTCTVEDRKGNFWVSTYGQGVLRLSPSGACERFTADQGLSHQAVRALWEDREGSLWVGTDGGGLNRLKPRLVTMHEQRDGLSASVVMSISQDPAESETLWLGLNGGGVNRLRGGQITPFVVEPMLSTNAFVYGLFRDGQGGLWIGNYDLGVLRYHEGKLACLTGAESWRKPLLTGLEDRAGMVWLGGGFGLWRWENGRFINLNAQIGWSNLVVRALEEDRAGNVFVGSFGRGLSRQTGGQWCCYLEKDGLADNHISSLYADHEDTLWIGTFNGGLSRFRNGGFTTYTMREGLPSNCILSILEDDSGNLWMGSNRGLFRVAKGQLDALAEGRRRSVMGYTYGLEDGLTTLECGGGAQPAACKTRDGRLWFATTRGLAEVDPRKLPANPRPPPVIIEEVLLDGQACELSRGDWAPSLGAASQSSAGDPLSNARIVSPRPLRAERTARNILPPELVVPPGRDRVEFRFTGLSFLAPEKVRFRYRLERYDNEWVEGGTERTARYMHLPAGHYQFHVTACNNDGVWNEAGAVLSMTVLPPWWATWWFRGCMLAGAAGLVFWAFESRIRRAEREYATQQAFSRRLLESQEEERKRIAAELHDSLGQNLLVIKNRALLGLQEPSASPRCAEQLGEISRAASQSLAEVREISHNLRPYQIDHLGLTKSLNAMARSVSGASGIILACDFDCIDHLLPARQQIHLYRIVQELLNNMVKHSNASEARLEVKARGQQITVLFKDDGCGFDPVAVGAAVPEKGGMGLGDIAERARLLGGTMVCESQRGQGVRWVLTIPVTTRG